MSAFVALLRSVNVGGTGKLAMSDLKAIADTAGFTEVRTYIASGNLLFVSPLTEAEVKAELETALAAHIGKPVAVLVRTAAEIAAVRDGNPFPASPPDKVAAVFLDDPPPRDAAATATGRVDEEISIGAAREIYVFYPSGGGRSKLKIACAAKGTARNMNTVAKVAEMAAKP